MTVSPMFSFAVIKYLAFSALTLALFSSCRSAPNGATETNAAKSPIVAESNSKIPFSTKEPENYQAEIVVAANGVERKTFVARSGALRRYDFNAGAKNQVSQVASDRDYLILPDKKIYAENSNGAAPVAAESWSDFLSAEWLAARSQTEFQKLETVDGATRYAVKPENAAQSEIVIFVDEARALPVRQEFYSTASGERVLNFAVELRNLKIPADESSFAVPADYRKVSIEEFRKVWRTVGD